MQKISNHLSELRETNRVMVMVMVMAMAMAMAMSTLIERLSPELVTEGNKLKVWRCIFCLICVHNSRFKMLNVVSYPIK